MGGIKIGGILELLELSPLARGALHVDVGRVLDGCGHSEQLS